MQYYQETLTSSNGALDRHRRRSAESLDPWMEFQSIQVVNENSKVFWDDKTKFLRSLAIFYTRTGFWF
ncbi:hypothetical protein RCL_jg19822.t1 [Rhizophagus clarus]|uniref:Uncharacterized protein n=1 Tax=Rhizophagus clarus TaxID=94130 RepID=A0A8H3LD96_9GLOM|nr:hypothetical protein RCL_jg19822.t1 [Rhizophagus clarus]